jgi:hypothetical protein
MQRPREGISIIMSRRVDCYINLIGAVILPNKYNGAKQHEFGQAILTSKGLLQHDNFVRDKHCPINILFIQLISSDQHSQYHVTRSTQVIIGSALQCHTRFYEQNQVLIVCVLRIIYSTHTDIECSQIAKCHE